MAVLDHNLGFNSAMNLAQSAAGHSVSGDIKKQVGLMDKYIIYRRQYQKLTNQKRNRCLKRTGLYKLYRELRHAPKTYKKNSTIHMAVVI